MTGSLPASAVKVCVSTENSLTTSGFGPIDRGPAQLVSP